ncbi:hypothetical protein C8J56DRAFT_1054510 [Mycena floridula]|nr:hypothetical protein C8J56DRAFT_1054510 [Mycena floridula]
MGRPAIYSSAEARRIAKNAQNRLSYHRRKAITNVEPQVSVGPDPGFNSSIFFVHSPLEGQQQQLNALELPRKTDIPSTTMNISMPDASPLSAQTSPRAPSILRQSTPILCAPVIPSSEQGADDTNTVEASQSLPITPSFDPELEDINAVERYLKQHHSNCDASIDHRQTESQLASAAQFGALKVYLFQLGELQKLFDDLTSNAPIKYARQVLKTHLATQTVGQAPTLETAVDYMFALRQRAVDLLHILSSPLSPKEFIQTINARRKAKRLHSHIAVMTDFLQGLWEKEVLFETLNSTFLTSTAFNLLL